MERNPVVIDNAKLDEWAHRRSTGMLRRWLAETHTLVPGGRLRLNIGPLRLDTEVVHHSPTGAHGFGPIHAVDSADRPLAAADPALLAAACSAAARSRAEPDAPIQSAAGSLVDWVLHSLASTVDDPAQAAADLAVLAESINEPAAACRWLETHLDSELVPAVRQLAPQRAEVESATATLLTQRSLAVIGVLGRRGVACEDELLAMVSTRLTEAVHAYPETAWLLRHWLTSPTLTDYAVVNGSPLCYAESGELAAPPVCFEVPNPLFAPQDQVPGVPIPTLGSGWSLRPVEINEADSRDVTLIHRWMNTEHVAAHWRQAWSWQRWHDELARQLSGEHSLPCVVSRDGHVFGYVELYRVFRDTLSRCYPYGPHDLGVHIAIGEQDATGRGLGSALLRAIAEGLLAADSECHRVVAEPNVHNAASIAAFRKAGYLREREVGLPGKNSALMVFSRCGTSS